jgi:hypothetical protein
MTMELKAGLTIDQQTPAYGFAVGETIYTVCDAVGVVFTTTHPTQLERFYVQS